MMIWHDPKDNLPPLFDLVVVRYASGYEQPAWWTGVAWDSGKKLPRKEVKEWKKYRTP